MKKPIIKFFDKIVILLLFIIGVFSSCQKDDPKPKYGNIKPMYGPPPPDKSVIVTQETSDIPLFSEVDLQDE
jgi:hypothetical protein